MTSDNVTHQARTNSAAVDAEASERARLAALPRFGVKELRKAFHGEREALTARSKS